MLEGLIIGVFVISCSLFLFSYIRPYFKAWVNCWFCNQNQWVPFDKRNAFKCTHCDQYNGFNKSGDYNRRLPKMFTEAANSVSSALRAATIGHKTPAANGLCDTCNKLQSVLMERLHKFEARDEKNYFDEYEAYKHRLDQQYPLCERCEAYTMQKLRLTQANYVAPAMSTFSGFARPPPSSAGSSKSSSIGSPVQRRQHDHGNRRRKLFFATGAKTISATVLNAVFSLVLFVAFYETTPAELPFHIAPKHLAEHVLPVAPAIAAGSTGAFFFGFKSSKSRITFLDLLGSVAWPIFTTFCLLDSSPKYDFHLLGTYMSVFLCLLSIASLLVPRKRKHLKRPNTIYSAFSIASTPMSQCSSRFTASRANLSVLPDDVSGSAEDEPMDTSDNVPEFNDRDNHSLFVGSTPSSKRSKAYLQYRDRREMSSREGTPAREINSGLDKLNLDDMSFGGGFGNIDEDADEVRSTRTSILSPKALTPSKKRVNSPFSSMTFNSNVRQSQPFSSFSTARSTATGSVFSGVTARSSLSSKFTSVSSPNNRQRFTPKAPLSFGAPSEVLTSVSQQQNSSNTAFYLAITTAIIAVLAFLAQTVYVFFYHQPVVVISPDAVKNFGSNLISSSTAEN